MRRVEFEPFRLTDAVQIFSIKINGSRDSEIKRFLNEFQLVDDLYLRADFDTILSILAQISKHGAKESFFRPEGRIQDRVCAIPVFIVHGKRKRNGSLRLYCLRVSDSILIIGGGGCKVTRTYEEDSLLSDFVTTLQHVDKELAVLDANGINLSNELINLTIYIK